MAPGTRSGGISGSQIERLPSALAGRHWRVPPSYSEPDSVGGRRAIDLRALSRAYWFVGDKSRSSTSKHEDEETHSPTTTVRLHVGGPISETGSGTGNHWQTNRANVVDLEILGDPSDIETIRQVSDRWTAVHAEEAVSNRMPSTITQCTV